MFVTPDYRGVNTSTGVKVCAVVDKKAKQSEYYTNGPVDWCPCPWTIVHGQGGGNGLGGGG